MVGERGGIKQLFVQSRTQKMSISSDHINTNFGEGDYDMSDPRCDECGKPAAFWRTTELFCKKHAPKDAMPIKSQNETKHTSGPWRIDGFNSITNGEVIRHGDYEIITVLHDFNRFDRDPEREANARLIAAAPDLLAVAEAVCFWWYDCKAKDKEARDDMIGKARAAILKARGEPQ